MQPLNLERHTACNAAHPAQAVWALETQCNAEALEFQFAQMEEARCAPLSPRSTSSLVSNCLQRLFQAGKLLVSWVNLCHKSREGFGVPAETLQSRFPLLTPSIFRMIWSSALYTGDQTFKRRTTSINVGAHWTHADLPSSPNLFQESFPQGESSLFVP